MWGVEGAGGCWKTDAAHTLERPLGGRGLISAVLAMSQRTWLGLDWERRKRLGNGGLHPRGCGEGEWPAVKTGVRVLRMQSLGLKGED